MMLYVWCTLDFEGGCKSFNPPALEPIVVGLKSGFLLLGVLYNIDPKTCANNNILISLSLFLQTSIV